MKFPRFVLVLSAGLLPLIMQGQGGGQQDFDSQITKADSFYYQGQYADALALLTPLDESLVKSNRNPADQSRVKMLIGLTEIALGEKDKARTRFVQFCSMNPDYVLDELQYPPPVVAVFKEAQQECTKCVQICAHAESMVAAGDTQGIAEAKTETEYCACASRAFARDEAALAPGRALMTQGKYGEAVHEFQNVLSAVPDSAARRDAVKTAQARVDSAVEAAIMEWRQQFQSRQWDRAAVTYDRIQSLGNDASRPVRDDMLQVTTRYLTTFEGLVSSWNMACSNNDRVALNTYREWVKQLDPNMTILPGVTSRMGECTTAPASRGNAK